MVPKQCLDIIAEFEGFRSSPYLCPAGIPTIGYGATYYPDGRKVQLSDPPVSEEKGREMLAGMVEKDFWNVLKVTVPCWEQMNDNQKSALTSFAYNRSGAHFYGSPGFNTVSACLRDRAWGEVPEPSCSTSTRDQPLKPGCADAAKPKVGFGMRRPGYGRTPN